MNFVFFKRVCFLLFFICTSSSLSASNKSGKIKKTLPQQKTYYHLGYPPYTPGWSPPGLFSTLRFVLGALYAYEQKINLMAGLEVDFGQEGPYYDPLYGNNSWEYYCEPIRLGNPEGAKIGGWWGIHGGWKDPEDVKILNRINSSREINHAILSKYVHVKPHITQKVNDIKHQYFKGFMIGVHYRGTDKVIEARRVPYQEVYQAVLRLIGQLNSQDYKIFVATDELAFLDFMEQAFPDKIVYYEQAYRSTTGKPIHFDIQADCSPYKKGEDAFIDCLLLSECHYLIATNSHLSRCSSFFNIKLPLVILNDDKIGN